MFYCCSMNSDTGCQDLYVTIMRPDQTKHVYMGVIRCYDEAFLSCSLAQLDRCTTVLMNDVRARDK